MRSVRAEAARATSADMRRLHFVARGETTARNAGFRLVPSRGAPNLKAQLTGAGGYGAMSAGTLYCAVPTSGQVCTGAGSPVWLIVTFQQFPSNEQ